MEQRLQEKDGRIEQAMAAIEHYRRESEVNRRKVQPWVAITLLALFGCAVVFIIAYLLILTSATRITACFKAPPLRSAAWSNA